MVAQGSDVPAGWVGQGRPDWGRTRKRASGAPMLQSSAMIPGSGPWRWRFGSRETWLAALLFTALTVLLAYPLSLHPATLRFPTGPDGDLGWYLLGWNTHAFLHKPWSIFEANIYYPQHLTLAYGENVIGISFFAAPVIWLTGNLLLAANLVCLLSCVLCGLGAYLLARRVGLSVAAAVIAGIIFECAPPRFFRIGQMNLSSVQWIPFGLAALHGYLDTGRKRDLRLAAGCVSMQALSSGHGMVFMAVALLVFGLYRVLLGEPLRLVKRVRDLGVSGALILLPTFLVFLPYRAVQRGVGLHRGLGSWVRNYEAFLASPSHLHQFLIHAFGWEHINQAASAFLFPGYLPLFLAIAALAWRRRPAVNRARRLSPRSSDPALVVSSVPGSRPDFLAPAPRVAESSGTATLMPVTPAVSATWRRAALALTLASLLFLVIAIAHAYHGPIRLRVGDSLIFRSRTPLRAWLLAAAFAAIRLALVRRAPLHLSRRLRAFRSACSALVQSSVEGLQRLPRVVRCWGRTVWAWLEPVRAWADYRRRDATSFYAVLTFITFGLALGPPYGLWRFVYWMPVFNFIRESSRFTLVGLLGVAVLAAIGFDRVARRLTGRSRVVLATVFSVLLVAEYAAMPIAVQPSNFEIPTIDRWLDTLPKPFVVAEVPGAHPEEDAGRCERLQTAFMVHSTAHWQKTVHGYSGWRTALHMQMFTDMVNFPDKNSVEWLTDLGVTYVVAHTDYYEPGEWSRVEARIRQYWPWLRLEHVEGAGRVYSVHKPPKGTLR